MTPAEQQEYLAEILRMAERFKAGESGRRVPMVAAAELPGQPAGNAHAIPTTPTSGPDLDEFAYTGTPSPPVQHAASMLPRGMGEQYGPIKMPGTFDPRLGPQIPQGYTEDEEGRIRDPNRNPAWFQAPSRKELAWDALTAVNPAIGGSVAMGATKLAGAAGHYAQPVIDMAKDYSDSVGEYVRRSGEALGRGGAAIWEGGKRLGRKLNEPVTGQQAAAAATVGAEALPGAGFVQSPKDMAEALAAIREQHYGQAAVSGFKSLANPALEIATLGTAGLMKKGAKAAVDSAQTWYHPIAKNKLGRPLQEMSATKTPTIELAPREIIQPQEVQGRILTTLPGDRTAAGSKLIAVNERPLAHEVQLQGGPEYMLANKALWASQPGASTTFQDRINQLAQQYGQKPLATFTAMGQRGGDYAHMNTDTVLGMLPSSKVLKKDQAAFDAAMRDRGFPEFIGISDDKKRDALREQMLGRNSGNLRKAFLDEMAAKPWQEKGFPDVGSARFATTNPDILHDPHLSSGYLIGETAPGRPTINDPSQHLTYSTQIPGKAIGGFERAIPIDVMYPDWYKTRPRGEGSPHTQRAIITQGPHQVANQKWVDRVSEYLRRERERDR